MNAFLDLLDAANRNGWCVKHGCTTCGASEFRSALRRVGGGDRQLLADALASIDGRALTVVPDWQDGLRIALDELADHELTDRVLMSWLSDLDRHVRLADIILFYLVRRGALLGPMSVETSRQWTSKCVELALRTKDESLVETVVYTLGVRYKDNPALRSVVHELARGSRRIDRAVKRQQRDG